MCRGCFTPRKYISSKKVKTPLSTEKDNTAGVTSDTEVWVIEVGDKLKQRQDSENYRL